MKYCPNCGSKISKDQKFCVNCGYRLLHNEEVKDQTNNYKSANYKFFKNKKAKIIVSGIIVLMALVGIFMWHRSTSINSNSPFKGKNITFGYYEYSYDNDGDEVKFSPKKRVSIASTIAVVDRVFAIMYKNGDGKSASYEYFKKHPRIEENLATTGGFFSNIKWTSDKLTKYRNSSEEVVVEYQHWLALLQADKKATRIWNDWEKWMKSCAPGDSHSLAISNMFTLPKSYIKYSGVKNRLTNGQKVQIKLGGNTKLLSKYNVDLEPITVKVTGLSLEPEEIEE